ncbi:MAG: hypothetical protein RIS88_2118 [Pseudomonadota bacterium]|jgi:hypothetical protein
MTMRLETRLLVDLAGSLAGDYPQGVKCETLAKRMAIRHDHCGKILHLARKAGLIDISGSGVAARWGTPSIVAELNTAYWTRNRLRGKKAREAKVAREQARLDAAELAPRRKAPLFTVRAPNSVWQLGEFMDLPPIEVQREKKLHRAQTSS